MLSERMVESLNDQINLEFYSSNLYLQMSAWCEFKGFEGCAAFLQHHATEEMEHMQRLFTYVNETGAMPILGTIQAPPTEHRSLTEVFRQTYEHEVYITKKINELAHTAFSEHDYSTFNFLQWYVAEQHEEEKLFKTVLDKIELIGEDGKGLYLIDKEMKSLLTGNRKTSIMKHSAEQ
jgi:ferritin